MAALGFSLALSACNDDSQNDEGVAAPIGSEEIVESAPNGNSADQTAVSKDVRPCPDSVPRRAVDSKSAVAADALPHVDNSVVERERAEEALRKYQANPGVPKEDVVDMVVGPGFGRAWVGESGGRYGVVNVDDFALVVVLEDASACPKPPDLHNRTESWVPVFFVTLPDLDG